MDHAGRQARVRARLVEEGLDALWVTNLVNVRYLCGFTGSSGALLVGRSASWFLTDGRYRTQSLDEVEGAEIDVASTPDEEEVVLRRAVRSLEAERIGFEADHVTVAGLEKLRERLRGGELVATSGWVERLRRVKEPDELARIRRAAELGDAALAHVLERVEPGRTEQDLALDLEVFMRRAGAEGVSFRPIVAAAERSALPHAAPTAREVEKGRFLLLDLGAVVDGYCSDLTRTVVVGSADDRHREVYEVVARAQRAGLEAVRPGTVGRDAHAAAREVIAAAGYGDAFGHGLGHGVGLEIHEGPSLRATSDDTLEAGNVVTVEPGVYLPGWGGVRIEDLVVVAEDGPQVLSASPKDLLVL